MVNFKVFEAWCTFTIFERLVLAQALKDVSKKAPTVGESGTHPT